MAYKRARYGLMPIDPEDLKDHLGPGTCARMEPADPRRNELRDVKRGAERGWGITDRVKDKAVAVVMEVLEDWNASNRDRLTAVGAASAMVSTDVRLYLETREDETIPWPEPGCADLVHARRTIRAIVEHGSADLALEAGSITGADLRRLEFTHARAWDDPRLTTAADKAEIAKYLLENYPEMFAEEDAEMARLLAEARSRDVTPPGTSSR